jgi:hypothetical protein
MPVHFSPLGAVLENTRKRKREKKKKKANSAKDKKRKGFEETRHLEQREGITIEKFEAPAFPKCCPQFPL